MAMMRGSDERVRKPKDLDRLCTKDWKKGTIFSYFLKSMLSGFRSKGDQFSRNMTNPMMATPMMATIHMFLPEKGCGSGKPRVRVPD